MGDPSPLVPGAIGGFDKVMLQKQSLLGYGVAGKTGVIAPLDDPLWRQKPVEELLNDVKCLMKVHENCNVEVLRRNKLEVLFCSPYHHVSDSTFIAHAGSDSILDEFFLDIGGVAKASVIEVLKCVFPNKEFDVKLSTNPTDMQTICDATNAVLILLSENPEICIQTLLPKIISIEEAVVIYHDGSHFFLTIQRNKIMESMSETPEKKKKLDSSDDPSTVEKKKSVFCACGKSRKGVNTSCTKERRCKCLQSGKGCGQDCKCFNCANPISRKVKKNMPKTKSCGCGTGASSSENKCSTNACPCYENKNGCNANPRFVLYIFKTHAFLIIF
jgi:hypothetical protein